MPDLVFITCSGLQILGKIQTGVFSISRFLVNPLKKYYHNSRTSDDIDMKLEQVTKIEKKNKTTSKKFDDDECQKFAASFSFFQFMANFDRYGSRISNA